MKRILTGIVFLFFCSWAAIDCSQHLLMTKDSTKTGCIAGIVLDRENKTPIVNANVLARPAVQLMEATSYDYPLQSVTDSLGRYVMMQLTDSIYELRIQTIYYINQEIKGIRVKADSVSIVYPIGLMSDVFPVEPVPISLTEHSFIKQNTINNIKQYLKEKFLSK